MVHAGDTVSPELKLNEANSWMSLGQHVAASKLNLSAMRKRFCEAKTNDRMSDAKTLFYNFGLHDGELKNTFPLVQRAEGNIQLTLGVQGPGLAFIYPNVFRV